MQYAYLDNDDTYRTFPSIHALTSFLLDEYGQDHVTRVCADALRTLIEDMSHDDRLDWLQDRLISGYPTVDDIIEQQLLVGSFDIGGCKAVQL